MKTNNIIYRNIFTLICFAISISIYGQGTIKTPKGQTIALLNGWDTPAWITTWESHAIYWINNYATGDIIKKGPATTHYNCHAYAWHIVDGGVDEDCWMNGDIPGTPNVSKYWTNDAYSTTTSAYKGDYKKIYYGDDADHSAILISSKGRVRSKWGEWGLYEHDLADCPFDSAATYSYYSVPLNGEDDIVCSSETYSTVNISGITGVTYNWSSSKVSTTGSGYSTTATETSNGEGYIQSEIYSPYSGTTITSERIDFWVGAPDLDNITVYYTDDLNNYGEYCPGSANELLARANPSIDMGTSIYWDMGSWDVYSYDNEGYVLFEIPLSFSGSESVYYEVSNACDVAITSETIYEGYCGGYFMVIAPNPASEETTLTIETTSEAESFDENQEWELEVYDQKQLLKTKSNDLKGKSAKIQTSAWKEGVYVVRVKYKDKVLQGKLIIKK